MKLRAEHVVFPDRGSKRFAVGGVTCDEGIVHRPREKTVDEIHVAAIGNVAKQGTVRPRDLNLVPADLRNFQAGPCGKTNHLSREDAQPGGATVELLALLKQSLVPD